jgi:photosystem II stability/assembly factor-like uncharacterized protein
MLIEDNENSATRPGKPYQVAWLFMLVACSMQWSCAWSKKSVDMRYYPRIRCSAFPSANAARLVTLSGDLLTTENGGREWREITGKDLGSFDHIAFIDDRRGWANTRSSEVLRTTDCGASWTRTSKLVDAAGGSLGEIWFLDDVHGWMVHPLAVWRTEDGGLRWRRSALREDPPKAAFFPIFITANVGWLSGAGGALYRTTDGGESWHLRDISAGTDDLAEVSFLDAVTGWTFSVTHPKIFWTFNGGETWEARPGPPGASGLLSLSFVSRREGWALAVGPGVPGQVDRILPNTLLHTTDGGETWQGAGVWKKEPNLHRVWFVDRDHGWLLGRTNVYRTENAGETWQIALEVK